MKIERGNTHDLGFYDIGGETKNVLEENWDYLIILDAGRFDFFNDLYRNHLNGNLKKAISPATTTMMWLNKVFTDFYEDIVYVSANPYINSRIAVTDQYGLKFEGKKHFFKVVDVWKFGWDERLGTVHPNSVNDAILTSAGKAITKSFGIEVTWKIINLVDGSPVSQPISIYIEEGMKGLRKAYRENLGLVLESVAELLENVSGNILITADHGEYLGENRRYGHGLVPRHPPIIEVPWLIIEGNRPKREKIIEREIIKERIERLKKMGKT
jgi:hypothetical protein